MGLVDLKNIGDDVIIDEDVYIKHPQYVSIGNRVAIDKGFYCTTQATIGDYVHISPYVTCIGSKKGEFYAHGFNNVMAGVRIVCGSDIFDSSGPHGALIPQSIKGKELFKPVVMEPFSNIGTNAVVLCGSILRKGVLLTIGSVLRGDTVEWGVYSGNPAKLVRVIDGERIIAGARELGYEF